MMGDVLAMTQNAEPTLEQRVAKLEAWSLQVSQIMDAELAKIHAKLAEMPVKQAG